MSYPINQNLKPIQQPAMGVVNTSANTSVPLQGIDADINQASSNPITQVSKNGEYLLTAGLTVPTWIGMMHLLKKFNASCGQEEGKGNLLKSMSNWGDKVANSSFLSSKTAGGVQGFFKRIYNGIQSGIDKTRITRSMFRTSTEPVSPMVTNFAFGAGGDLAHSISNIFGHYVNPKINPKATGELVDGKSIDKIIELGFKDKEEFDAITKAPHKNIERIAEICKHAAEHADTGFEVPFSVEIPFTKKNLSNFMPEFMKKFLKTKVNFQSLSNQLNIFAKPEAATALGRALPKTAIRLIQALTFGLGGAGKVGLAFQAVFIASAAAKAIKAEAGDKIKTFAENMASTIGWYLTIPLAIGVIHKAGGLKHIGLTAGKTKEEAKKALEDYNNARELFNKKAEMNLFTNKDAYIAEKKSLKAMINPKWYYKPFKLFGDILTVGLERIRPYMPQDAKGFRKFLIETRYNAKGWAGYPMRLIPYMFMIAPFFDKICVKTAHMFFGRPKHSMLDEEEAGKDENAALKQLPQNKGMNQAAMATATNAAANTTAAQPKAPQAPARTYIPSTEPVHVTSNQATGTPSTPSRNYIPSPIGVQGQPQSSSNDKAQAALNQSLAPEKYATKFLG